MKPKLFKSPLREVVGPSLPLNADAVRGRASDEQNSWQTGSHTKEPAAALLGAVEHTVDVCIKELVCKK
jgi:hypothetical protein